MAKQTPGGALSALLKKYKLNYNRLAKAIGLSSAMVRLIARDENPVSAPVAFRLAKFFKNKPDFWLSLQAAYDLARTVADKKLAKELKDIPTVDKATFERKTKAKPAKKGKAGKKSSPAKTKKTAKTAKKAAPKKTTAKKPAAKKAAPKKAAAKKPAAKKPAKAKAPAKAAPKPAPVVKPAVPPAQPAPQPASASQPVPPPPVHSETPNNEPKF